MSKVTITKKTQEKMSKEREVRMFQDILTKGDIVKYIPKDKTAPRMFYKVLTLDKGVFDDGTFMFNSVSVQKLDNEGGLANNKFTCHISKVYRFWLQPKDRVSFEGEVYEVDKIFINASNWDEVLLRNVISGRMVGTTKLDSLQLIVG